MVMLRKGRGAAVLVVAAFTLSSGASRERVAWEPTCMAAANGVRWVSTAPANERAALDRWCAGVGPPAYVSAARATDEVAAPLVVVSWNTHAGAGDLPRFVADLRAGRLTGRPVRDFVLLLQEAYRDGEAPAVPGVEWASAEPVRTLKDRWPVIEAANRLGLSAFYVPSMRNGRPSQTREDRGNAILSTRPLSDLTAIELPLERQRRVSLAATVTLSPDRSFRIVCTHFTNMVMHHLWVLSESGRLRQARALGAQMPPEGPLIVGGDFNAWFGFRDAAYRELTRRLSPPASQDTRPTFGPLRLDHLLFRLPQGWRAEIHRADDKYGSDHYALIATVTIG
jgi:endonuclease/exonuclease/phosphatase family metal-dependent hydrolase